MKRFHCVALDSKWQTCAGTFDSEDLETAKQRVLRHGYSILHIREVAADGEPADDFFENPVYPAQQTEATGSKAPEAFRKTVTSHPAGQSPRFTLPPILLMALILLFSSFLAAGIYFYKPKETILMPEQIVHKFVSMGIRGEWALQYELITRRKRSIYASREHYVKEIQNSTLALAVASSFPSGESDLNTAARLQIDAITQSTEEAKLCLTLTSNAERKAFDFILANEAGRWRIDYIRDLQRIEEDIRFLARNYAGSRKESILMQLSSEYGYSSHEILAMTQKYALEAAEEDLKASLPEKKPGLPLPQKTAQAEIAEAVVETSAVDAVEEEMRAMINGLSSLEEVR